MLILLRFAFFIVVLSSRSSSNADTIYDLDLNRELCNNATIDTMFFSAQLVSYVFKGEYYWRLKDKKITRGYPRLISTSWIGLPGNIDAAFTIENGKTYFFKGAQYWKYTRKNMDEGYPKNISDSFPGIPNDIDAAMVWHGNGKIYFFKGHAFECSGSKFWAYDKTESPPVKSSYPKPISKWGVPDDLDAAVPDYNGSTFFFKGGRFWKFNDDEFKIATVDPPYPRSVGQRVFGCPRTKPLESQRTDGDPIFEISREN